MFAITAGLSFVPLTMTLVAGISDEHAGIIQHAPRVTHSPERGWIGPVLRRDPELAHA